MLTGWGKEPSQDRHTEASLPKDYPTMYTADTLSHEAVLRFCFKHNAKGYPNTNQGSCSGIFAATHWTTCPLPRHCKVHRVEVFIGEAVLAEHAPHYQFITAGLPDQLGLAITSTPTKTATTAKRAEALPAHVRVQLRSVEHRPHGAPHEGGAAT